MWSTVRYASHSELARQKPKREFLQKTKSLDLKIQKKPYLHGTNK